MSLLTEYLFVYKDNWFTDSFVALLMSVHTIRTTTHLIMHVTHSLMNIFMAAWFKALIYFLGEVALTFKNDSQRANLYSSNSLF